MAAEPGILPEEIPDLVDHTLPYFFEKGRFETVFQYQRYCILDELFDPTRVRVRSGNSIEWRYVLDDGGTFRHTLLFEPRGQRNLRSVGLKAGTPWNFADFEAYYEGHLMTMMRGDEEILDYIESQFFVEFANAANKIEAAAANVPEDATDRRSPYGFPWWIRGPDAGVEDYVGSFGGQTAYYQDGTSTTSDDPQGNLDRATQPKLRNWCGNHNGFGMQLVEAIARGQLFMNYVPPKLARPYSGGAGDGRNIGEAYILWPMEFQHRYNMLVNNRSDGRNRDVLPFGTRDDLPLGSMMTKGLPTLNDKPLEPVYIVNFKYFFPVVHDGWWMNRKKTRELEDPVNVYFTHVDLQYGYIDVNPRLSGACWTRPRS